MPAATMGSDEDASFKLERDCTVETSVESSPSHPVSGPTLKKLQYEGKDIFVCSDGTTYHVGVKPGDVYPRIITVGAIGRAEQIAQQLDEVEHDIFSGRLFRTISGKYKGIGISIIGIGMGAPMMDFMVREVSYVHPGPLAVIRLGTCGLWNSALAVGTVVTAGQGCSFAYQNVAKWTEGVLGDDQMASQDYIVTKPLPCDAKLNALFCQKLRETKLEHHDGLNIGSDTFFACQARKSGHFENGDAHIIERLALQHNVSSMEMETFTLMLLAKMRTVAPLYAAAGNIGVVQRANESATANITPEQLQLAENQAGKAALEALIRFDIGDENYPPYPSINREDQQSVS